MVVLRGAGGNWNGEVGAIVVVVTVALPAVGAAAMKTAATASG